MDHISTLSKMTVSFSLSIACTDDAREEFADRVREKFADGSLHLVPAKGWVLADVRAEAV